MTTIRRVIVWCSLAFLGAGAIGSTASERFDDRFGAATLSEPRTPPPPPEPLGVPGACCIGQICEDNFESKCDGLGGTFQGEGTTCAMEPCTVGACCYGDGSCFEESENFCRSAFGIFHGVGSPCAQVQCAGACCDPDTGDCTLDGFDCFGDWQGPGTDCSSNPCPQPNGACCAFDGSCTEITEEACASAGGTFEGDRTTCSPNPCPQPNGACCAINGSCIEVTAAACQNAGGTFQGNFTTCTSNPCPQPNGACCFDNGSCTEVPEAACSSASGNYQGDFTDCSPNPCPQPNGACCAIDGSCTEVTEEACASAGDSFQGDFTNCSQNECPQPNGACCAINGSCTEVTEEACASAGGKFQGDFTTCVPNPCPQPNGACCAIDGSCTEETEEACASAGGKFQGNFTTCTPNPCPQPNGACCSGNGSCTEVTEEACTSGGGEFQGDFTECTPNPCPQPGACCFLDGSCEVHFPYECAALDGNFRGTGLECDEVACPNPGAVLSELKISEISGGFGGGQIQGGHFGGGVGEIGDVDGDGVTDLAVGEPFDNDGAQDGGAVWIVFMNTDGTVKAEQKISATQGGLVGPISGDRFGHGVAGIGDLDDDGVPDLAVGAPLDDDGGIDAGSVWILLLNDDGTVKDEQKISATQGGFVGPLAADDEFGAELSELGDLDDDGVNDLAVGAHGDDDGASSSGSVFILFLNANGTVKDEQKISNFTGGFGGQLGVGDNFGLAVRAIDDLDGDGITDLVVGAPGNNGNDQGAVWILFLDTDGTVQNEAEIAEDQFGLDVGLVAGDTFGRAVAAPGDLNGDGVPDLVVGAPGDDDGGSDVGAVYVIFLRSDGGVFSPLKVTEGAGGFDGSLDVGDRFGASLASLGDLDGDGVADVAAASPLDDDGSSDSGAVWVLYLDGVADVTFEQVVESPAAGVGNKEATGDLDGDGDPDVVIVIPDANAIQVFLNNGTNLAGTWLGFTPQLPVVAVGMNPSGVAIGYLDDDSDLDVVVSNQDSDTVSVLLGNGTGALALDATIPVGNEPTAVAIADFSNDSSAPFEIAVTNQADDTMIVLENASPLAPGLTTLWQIQETVATGDAPVALEPEDVDNDKNVDAIILNHGNDSATVALWQNASEESQINVAVGAGPVDLAAGDLDGDGLSEIVTANADDGTVTVLRNTTTGRGVAFGAAQPEVVGEAPSSVTLADLDGDGDADLAVTAVDEIEGPALMILENHSSEGSLVFSPPVTYAIGSEPTFVVEADLDGDGVTDLVTVNTDEDQPSGGSVTGLISQVCPGDTDGGGTVGFGDLTQVLLHWGPCPEPPSLCPWDVNGDGTVGFADLTVLLLNWGDCA